MRRSTPSMTPGRTSAQILPFPGRSNRQLPTIELESVREAQTRLRPYVRRTPIMQARLPSVPSDATAPIHLKLENLQVGGTADVWGVLNFALSLPPEQLSRGLVTAAWGNVGSAVSYIGHLLGVSTTVYMVRPFASSEKIAAIERWGAKVIVQGSTWHTTERIAAEHAVGQSASYIHPFSDPTVIAGDATVAPEVIENIGQRRPPHRWQRPRAADLVYRHRRGERGVVRGFARRNRQLPRADALGPGPLRPVAAAAAAQVSRERPPGS